MGGDVTSGRSWVSLLAPVWEGRGWQTPSFSCPTLLKLRVSRCGGSGHPSFRWGRNLRAPRQLSRPWPLAGGFLRPGRAETPALGGRLRGCYPSLPPDPREQTGLHHSWKQTHSHRGLELVSGVWGRGPPEEGERLPVGSLGLPAVRSPHPSPTAA